MSIKKNFLFNATLSISQIIFPIVTFPYVTRILMPKGLGTVNFIDSFVQYILIIAALGIPVYGVREIARVKGDPTKLSKTYSELLIIHSVLSIISALIFYVMILNVPKLSGEYELCMIGVGIILTNIFMINWLYGGLEKFVFISIVSISVRVLMILGIFILVKSPEDKVLYYGLNLLGNLITGIINISIASKHVKFSFNFFDIRKHFSPLFMLFSLTVITSVYVLLDSVILGFLKNNVEVGYYTTAMKLSKIPITLLTALTSVLIPKLTASTANNNLGEVSSLIDKSMNASLVISIPIAFGMFSLSREIILVFAGSLYLPALPSFQILSFIIIPISLALISYQVLLPRNKEKYMMFCSIIGMSISLLLNFILIPAYGGTGSAMSSIVTEFMVAIMLFFVSRKLVSILIPYRMICSAIITCTSFFLFKYIFQNIFRSDALVIISTAISGSLFYLIMMGVVFRVKLVRELYALGINKFTGLL